MKGTRPQPAPTTDARSRDVLPHAMDRAKMNDYPRCRACGQVCAPGALLCAWCRGEGRGTEVLVRTLVRQRNTAMVCAYLMALACVLALTGCAHTPDPPGEPCPSWEAGWMESRRDECDVWRCSAATLRWERLEVCE